MSSTTEHGKVSIMDVLVAASCIALIAFLIAVLILRNDREQIVKRVQKSTVCWSSSCRNMKDLLQASVSASVNPCTHFYAYTCTHWAEVNAKGTNVSMLVSQKFADKIEAALEARQPSMTSQNMLDMITVLYQSCRRSYRADLRDSMKKVFEQFHLGGWPHFGVVNPDQYDIFKIVTDADMNWNMGLVFTFERSYSVDHSDMKVSIRHTQHACPYDDIMNKTMKKEYKEFARKVLELYSYHDSGGSEKIVNIHLSLCNATKRVSGTTYKYHYFDDLVSSTLPMGLTKQNWLDALNPMAILESKSVVYTDLAYVTASVSLFKQTALDDSLLFLGFMTLIRMAFVHEGLEKIMDEYYYFKEPFFRESSHSNPCVNVVISHFKNAWNLFTTVVDGHGGIVADDVRRLVRTIRSAATRRIRLTPWMDERSKSRTLSKLKRAIVVLPLLSSYGQVFNATERYRGIEPLTYDFYDNLLKVRKNDAAFRVSGFQRSIDDPDFVAAGGTANLRLNMVNVCAGLLRLPYYSHEFPVGLKYGGIGTVVARLVAQLVADQGAKTNEIGTSSDWWSGETFRQYQSRARCIASQQHPGRDYSNLGMADDAEYFSYYLGTSIAFSAFRHALADSDSYTLLPFYNATMEQLFFLNYCLVLCASEINAAGISKLSEASAHYCHSAVMNMPEFTKAFSCDNAPINNVTSREVECDLF